MGAGKTTVGRRLASLLDCEFIDTDQVIEERTGVSISHIFEVEGEAGFRERESRVLEEISERQGAVVSTGGGIVLDSDNCRIMADSGTTFYLQATIDTLWRRLRNCRNRPLLQSENPKQKLEELLQTRAPAYLGHADHVVEVVGDSAKRTAYRIRDLIQADNDQSGASSRQS